MPVKSFVTDAQRRSASTAPCFATTPSARTTPAAARPASQPSIARNADFTLVASVSPRDPGVEDIANFKSLETLLADGPAIDAIALCTPPQVRYELAAMALDHPSVKAGFAISGIYELGPLRDTYANDKLRLADAEVGTLSPLRLPVTDKPLALAYGTAELPPLVENSQTSSLTCLYTQSKPSGGRGEPVEPTLSRAERS